jgi:hypothetical protein
MRQVKEKKRQLRKERAVKSQEAYEAEPEMKVSRSKKENSKLTLDRFDKILENYQSKVLKQLEKGTPKGDEFKEVYLSDD